MKRVLFVDDEPMILAGLKQALYRQRSRWQMHFVESADAALRELQESPFDVVVTDMRMPGMDGPALLQEVRARYPDCARVVLSGQSGREELLRALPVAQQWLSKPCPPETLCAAIERICRIQELISNDTVRRLLGKVASLPTLPQLYHELSAALIDPDTTAADLAAIVERDTALTVKALQLVNSAYFGLATSTTSVLKAVRHIGVDLLRALVASNQIYGAVNPTLFRAGPLAQLPDRAMQKAQLTRHILKQLKIPGDEAFAAALMVDTGLIVLALGDAGSLERVWNEAMAGSRRIERIERERLGITHAGIGAALLGLWGLPPTLVELVASLHEPLQPDSEAVAVVLAVADALVDARHLGFANLVDGIDPDLRAHPLVAEHLAAWVRSIEDPLADAAGNAA